MLTDPRKLETNLDRLEEIEKASLQMITQALWEFRETALEIFRQEADWVADIGEDTTIFVKYNYDEIEQANHLRSITIAALPNGLLQEKYNASFRDTIWLAGRNSPQRGEEFRVRLDFASLKRKAIWRIQRIPMPPESFTWDS